MLELKVVLEELQRKMKGALKEEWIDIGLDIGELVHHLKRSTGKWSAVLADVHAATELCPSSLGSAR